MTRSHALLAFIALAVLRVVVGFHFFKEGKSKLDGDTFKSSYFLSAAKGPLAPTFKSMLDDPDGRVSLGVKTVSDEYETQIYKLDPAETFDAWEQYVAKAKSYYGFGSEDLQGQLAADRKKLGEQIREARDKKDASVNTTALEIKRAEMAQSIKHVRGQATAADAILQDHRLMLASWLDFNKTEIVSHFGTTDRLKGFIRDGDNRGAVGEEVQSLRWQIDEIESDRGKKMKGWKKQVADIWTSLETQINDLAVAEQTASVKSGKLPLERLYAPSNSMIAMVDQFIPWFDLVVGSLLILGLFSRLASLAGAGFLLSVLATQPPWVADVTTSGPGSVYLYMIEFAALLVIFATCAGRNFGLDYFLHAIFGRQSGHNNTTTSSVETGA